MRLLYITNIPAPYRNARFNLMQEIFPKMGIEFEVLYMARTEPNRSWVFQPEAFRYNYRIFSGYQFKISNMFAHINPRLLLRLLKDDYDIAIVGGMGSPTHWLAPFFISSRKIQLMSIESNMHSVKRTRGIGAWLKQIILRRAHAYQVTGVAQTEYIKFFDPDASSKPFVTLPNLIDEEDFINKVDLLRTHAETIRAHLGVNTGNRMLLMPARLVEDKGIIPFLKGLDGFDNYHLFVLGTGPLRGMINESVQERQIKVTLVDFVDPKEIIKYYAAADVFVLPSLRDPSPLSVIEAMAAGLPLLISNRLGNLTEVFHGDNGWSFTPENIDDVHGRIADALHCSEDLIRLKGRLSREYYFHWFGATKCIKRYGEQLLQVVQERTT